MDKEEIRKLIREEIEKQRREAQYGVSRVPYHTHNNLDSPPIARTNENQAAGGNNKDIQYNNSGTLAGSDNFMFDATTTAITLANGGSTTLTITSTLDTEIATPLNQSIHILTGGSVASGQASGPIAIETSPTDAADAGDITLQAGGANGGEAGDIFITAGSDGDNGGGDVRIVGGEALTSGLKGVVRLGYTGLSTSTTGGFVFFPSCSGTPTGTTGNVAEGSLIYDSSAGKLWVRHSGAWKSVTFT